MERPRIAVLGAGPMGLAVAYQLVRDGHAPVIFEADDRLGGMTASFDFGGLAIERFYHYHCTNDTAFLDVLEELGIARRLRWVATKMGYYHRGKVHPWGTPLALARFPALGPIDKLRCAAHALVVSRSKDWSKLDALEAQAWLRGWLGDKAFDVLWKQLLEQKFHHHASDLSAAWIWSRIRRIGRSRDRLFRERLGHLDGGSQTLLDALGEFIAAGGGEIRLATPISKVVLEGGAVKGLVTPSGFEPFSRLVSTIPLAYVPRIFSDLPREILAQYRALPYIAVVCVIAKLRRALTEHFWLNVSDRSMDIPGLVEYTNLRPLDHHVVYVPYYLPAEHPKYAEPDAAFIARVKGYLLKINPSLTEADFIDVRASRYRYAQPICEPRFLENLPPIQLPVHGLVLADTSFYYPEDRGISESIALGRKMARIVTRGVNGSSPSSA